MPEATTEGFRHNGWFLTWNIRYSDNGGILIITDRKKDMNIMSGWKIYPTEAENVIICHPAVADLAVFGIPDERKGEVPVAVVVLKSGMTLTEAELETFSREHLADYKIPRKCVVVDALPRVNGWKLLRGAGYPRTCLGSGRGCYRQGRGDWQRCYGKREIRGDGSGCVHPMTRTQRMRVSGMMRRKILFIAENVSGNGLQLLPVTTTDYIATSTDPIKIW